MQKRLSFIAGSVIGFVFGARAGRERYEQIKALSLKAMSTPPAQKAKGAAQAQVGQLTQQAKGKAADLTAVAKSTVGDKVSSAVSDGRARLSGATSGSDQSEVTLPVTGEAGEQAFAPKTGSGYSI
jgi:hypothetical protein